MSASVGKLSLIAFRSPCAFGLIPTIRKDVAPSARSNIVGVMQGWASGR